MEVVLMEEATLMEEVVLMKDSLRMPLLCRIQRGCARVPMRERRLESGKDVLGAVAIPTSDCCSDWEPLGPLTGGDG